MSISNLVLLLFLSSVFIQGSILWYATAHRSTSGAPALAGMTGATLLWTLGAFLEVLGPSIEWKVVWRNFTQVGVTALPVAMVNFSLLYAGHSRTLRRRVVAVVGMTAVIALALLLTDHRHGIMRRSVELVEIAGASGGTAEGLRTLRVDSTLFARLLLSYVPIANVVSVLVLLAAARGAGRLVRRQLVISAVAILLPILFILVKSMTNAGMLLFVPTPVSFIPMGLALVWAIFRYRMAAISPIARNQVFDVIEEGIVVCDPDGSVIDVNRSAHAVLCGTDDPPASQDGSFERLAAGAIHAMSADWWRAVTTGDAADLVVESRQPYRQRSYRVRVSPLYDRAALPVGTISVIRDVTQETTYQHFLRSRAEQDLMTGLLNKTTFFERLQAAMEEGVASRGVNLALLVVDIDAFKSVNDRNGHQVGDELIVAVADVLRTSVQEHDLVGRIGGDEFAVFLPETTQHAVDAVAERIRGRVSRDGTVSVSIGCALEVRGAGGDARGLFHRADAALYRAKRNGRNRVAW